MADDPLPPITPELVRYEEKIRARLAGGLIASFTIIVVAWTFHPPQLPGDMAGAIVGGFVGWIGGISSAYWMTRGNGK